MQTNAELIDAHNAEPRAERPAMPEDYGVPAGDEGIMSWEHAETVIRDALNYWIATTSATGRPHVRPVWGVWLDGTIYFDGHPATAWGRNITRDPRISVQIEVGDEAFILEGRVTDIAFADPDLAQRLADEFNRKYDGPYSYHAEPGPWVERGLWSMRPAKAFAWEVATFPASCTRWTFDSAANAEGEAR